MLAEAALLFPLPLAAPDSTASLSLEVACTPDPQSSSTGGLLGWFSWNTDPNQVSRTPQTLVIEWVALQIVGRLRCEVPLGSLRGLPPSQQLQLKGRLADVADIERTSLAPIERNSIRVFDTGTQVVANDIVVEEGCKANFDISFRLPANAVPTYRGNLFTIAYAVHVAVQVRGADPTLLRAPFHVFAGLPRPMAQIAGSVSGPTAACDVMVHVKFSVAKGSIEAERLRAKTETAAAAEEPDDFDEVASSLGGDNTSVLGASGDEASMESSRNVYRFDTGSVLTILVDTAEAKAPCSKVSVELVRIETVERDKDKTEEMIRIAHAHVAMESGSLVQLRVAVPSEEPADTSWPPLRVSHALVFEFFVPPEVAGASAVLTGHTSEPLRWKMPLRVVHGHCMRGVAASYSAASLSVMV